MAKKKAAKKPAVILSLTKADADLVSHALDVLGTEMKQCSIDTAYSAAERRAFRRMWDDCVRLGKATEGGE